MSSLTLIVNSHDLAHLKLERLNILLLLLPGQQGLITESQENCVNQWMMEIVDDARDAILAAADALADMKEEDK